MSKIRLVVRSTTELRSEINLKQEALRNAQADLKEAQERLKYQQEQVRDAQMDVRTLTDLKDSFEDRLSELQFQLGQNDIYEQMIDQGIIPEGDKE